MQKIEKKCQTTKSRKTLRQKRQPRKPSRLKPSLLKPSLLKPSLLKPGRKPPTKANQTPHQSDRVWVRVRSRYPRPIRITGTTSLEKRKSDSAWLRSHNATTRRASLRTGLAAARTILGPDPSSLPAGVSAVALRAMADKSPRRSEPTGRANARPINIKQHDGSGLKRGATMSEYSGIFAAGRCGKLVLGRTFAANELNISIAKAARLGSRHGLGGEPLPNSFSSKPDQRR
jgi:hypothetical protein